MIVMTLETFLKIIKKIFVAFEIPLPTRHLSVLPLIASLNLRTHFEQNLKKKIQKFRTDKNNGIVFFDGKTENTEG